jgi:uncharacterized protein
LPASDAHRAAFSFQIEHQFWLRRREARELFTSNRQKNPCATRTSGSVAPIADSQKSQHWRARRDPAAAGADIWSLACKTTSVTVHRTNALAIGAERLKAQLIAWATEKTTPARTALGFATGIFIGIFPSFAVGSLIALYLASRLGLHRGAALSGTFLMNPLTAPLFYSLSYAVGARFAGLPLSAIHGGLLASLRQLGWAFLLGNAVVALCAASLCGLAVYVWMRHAESCQPAAQPVLELPAPLFPA